MLLILLIALIVSAGTGGDLCVARAMRTLGEVTDFRPRAIARVLGRAMRTPWLWAGIGLMAVAFFSLLAALSIENVSFVVPVTALSYVGGAVGGAWFLGERVSPQRSLGVILVVVGVSLVCLGRS